MTEHSSAPRILIVRLSAHGDVAHTLPLLHALKHHRPDAHVGWLVEASAAPLLEGHPLIDRLHVSQRKQWLQAARNPLRWPAIWREVRTFIADIQAERYTVSLDVQGLLKSALWPWMAGIPERLGNRQARERAEWFYTRRLAPHPIRVSQPSAVRKYLEFAEALGVPVSSPVFTTPPRQPESLAKVARWLAPLPADRPVVALAPFTRWPSKHWHAPYWSELIQSLLADGYALVLLGGPENAGEAARMLSDVPAGGPLVNLAGQTDWPDLYALFDRVDAVIGLDSAPLHIANAVNRPRLLALFGPTAPGRTGPVGEHHQTLTAQVSCQPCFEHTCPLGTHACMIQLTPDRVRERLHALLPVTSPLHQGTGA